MGCQILKDPSGKVRDPAALGRLGDVEAIIAVDTDDGADETFIDEASCLEDYRIVQLVVVDA